MDFSLTPKLEALRLNTRSFVHDQILPLECDRTNFDKYENIRLDVLEKLRRKVKNVGLWAPQAMIERGGLGLSHQECAVIYEEANHSIFGPAAFNCAAPDDGNISVISKIGTKSQQDWWLQPLIDGRVRSAFAMTEPAPGSGSDPAGMMLTKAEKKGDSWIVSGRKWFITGAGEAKHFILIARTSDDPRKGLSAFLYHADQPGHHIERRIPIMGPEEHGGHCEIVFNELEIPNENLLLNVGDGLKVTQIRLGTARLTHCMRWLGLAKRSMDIAAEYIAGRTGFGIRLADRESVQIKMGELAHDIQIGRLLVMHAAWKLDKGDFARKEISSAKIHVANTLHKSVDSAIQFNGARGYSKDTVLEWIYRYARQARLVDGADEVHKMILAKTFEKSGLDFWNWDT